jgi:hypothetical protein
MLYAILAYNTEATTEAMPQADHDSMMAKLAVVRRELAAEGKLGPVGRLMPTTAANTVRHGREAVVIDGPFAETKEQLLGLYVVDCATLEDAVDVARRLAAPRVEAGLAGALEIRPFRDFYPAATTK